MSDNDLHALFWLLAGGVFWHFGSQVILFLHHQLDEWRWRRSVSRWNKSRSNINIRKGK